MTVRCAFALGEVPWERALLDAAASTSGLTVSRRFVDASGVTRERADAPDVLLASPALRGFTQKAMRSITDSGVRVTVIVDSIRPTWLGESGLEVLELNGLDAEALFAGMTAPAPKKSRRALRTVFVGTGGGVGVTTLACAVASNLPGTRFVEADTSRPSAALLLGEDHPGVQPLAVIGSHDRIADALQDDVHHVIIDAGDVDGLGPWCDDARLVLIAPATPLGIVRMCTTAESLAAGSRELVLVLNQVRASATGSSRGGAALRALVERSTGIDPVLLPDRSDLCDAAWLRGDVRPLRELVLPLLANSAQHYEAA